MTATVIPFNGRLPGITGQSKRAALPPISAGREGRQIRRRIGAIENHRRKMAGYQYGDDPIFKAIDAHCAAVLAYHTAPEEASGDAMKHEGKVLRELMSCMPNSLDGILALLNHLGQPEFLIYGREGTDMTILQQVFEIAQKEGQRFPLELEATLRDVIIAMCSRPPRRK